MSKYKKNLIWPILIFSLNLVLFVSCGSMVFFPDKRIIPVPGDSAFFYESVFIKSGDRTDINGWWVPYEGAEGTVLFSHGNAGNISNRVESIKVFKRLKLNVFIYDYRGYGLSKGNPTEHGVYLDAEAAWNYIVDNRKISPDKIIIFGRSLGGSIACWLAQNHKSKIVILESTFTSAADVTKHHYFCLPSGLMFGDSFNTKKYIKNVSCPVLIIHSRDDEIIPYQQALELYRTANDPKEFLEIYGTHNRGFMKSLDLYEAGLNKFIDRYFRGSPDTLSR